MALTEIDPVLFLKVRPLLDPHERLLWVGRPNEDRVAMENQELVICGVILTALGLSGVPGMGVNASTLLLFGPFVLGGLLLLWAPAHRVAESSGTLFALTRERLIILKADGGRHVRSLGPADIGGVQCVEDAGGTGDLIIALRTYRDGLKAAAERTVKLAGIPHVREVEALLRATLRASEG